MWRSLVPATHLLAALWLAGCGDDDTVRPGITCGATMCESGQACCLDCDGTGECGEPGLVCEGRACQSPADGSTGLTCGENTCLSGQVCCLDCDGGGTCTYPGLPCPGIACRPPDANTTFTCVSIRCEIGQTCCGTCGDPFCGPPGSDCASPPEDCSDAGVCGTLDQPCCQGSCSQELQCCEGVPYPEGGLCEQQCLQGSSASGS